MEKIGLSHRPKRNPKGITKADREARKSDDLLKRNFTSEKPLEKCVTDITEIKAKDGKLYVSAIFDCFDSAVLGLAMETTMKATLCQHTVENAFIAYPEIRGIFLLIVKMFHMSIKQSQLETKIKDLAQKIALDENERGKEAFKIHCSVNLFYRIRIRRLHTDLQLDQSWAHRLDQCNLFFI